MLAAATAALLTAATRIDRYTPEEEAGGILARMASGFAHARDRHPALPALVTADKNAPPPERSKTESTKAFPGDTLPAPEPVPG